MPGLARLILEDHEDLINAQDDLGRSPLSWATERSLSSIPVLLGHKDIRPELVDSQGLAPIDYLFQQLTGDKSEVIPLLVPFLEHGINRVIQHGCTLLHFLIDSRHWDLLEHYEGRNIFDLREAFADPRGSLFTYDDEVVKRYMLGSDKNTLREALGAAAVTADQIRASPCKCGIGSVFLAISSENAETVEILLDLYPELMTDRFFDGSSPLDLANCINDRYTRRVMVDLIVSKDPDSKTSAAQDPA